MSKPALVPPPSALAKALHAQKVVNDTIAARKAAEKADAAAVVAAIHAAFATDESAVLGVTVGNYYAGAPVTIASLTEATGPMRQPEGLKIPVYRAHDGYDLLRVTVCARDDAKPGYVKLVHVPSRGWVARGEAAKLDLTLDLYIPPAELLDRLFAELAKYVREPKA